MGGQTGGQTDDSKSKTELNSSLTDRQQQVFDAIKANPRITRQELAKLLEVNPSAVQKHVKALQKKGAIVRHGGDFGGYWSVEKNDKK